MKRFKYKAKKGPSELQEGVVLAESQDEAIDKINEMGLLAVAVDEEASARPAASKSDAADGIKKIRRADLVVFHRQLAKLIKSGIPITRALALISSQMQNKALRQVARSIQQRVQEGQHLSAAFSAHAQVFGDFEVAMIQAGESAGNLENALERIARYREQQAQFASKVRGALMYPCFIALLGFFTVVFMLIYVIPQYAKFFAGLGQTLPLPTRVLILLSRTCQNAWPVIVIAAVVLWVIIQYGFRGHGAKYRLDLWFLRLPYVGFFLLKVQLIRFFQTLTMLLGSGIQLIRALAVAEPILDNAAVKAELRECRRHLEQGSTLADAMARGTLFPAFATDLVRMGEEAGRLEDALTEVADWYEREVDASVRTIAALLEPLMILAVGAAVGFIVIAVLLPVFSINAMVQ